MRLGGVPDLGRAHKSIVYFVTADTVPLVTKGNKMKLILTAAIGGLAALLALAQPAQAQRRDEKVGRVGNVDIVRVFEGRRFDRCYGMIPDSQLGARLFWAPGRDYVLTVPGINPPGEYAVSIRTPRGAINLRARTDGGNGRTIIPLNGPNTEKFMSLPNSFTVKVHDTSFPFTMRGTTMQDMFVAVEDCAHNNSR